MITEQSIVCRGTDHVESNKDGRYALMHVKSGKFYAVHDTTAAVWTHIEEPIQVADLIDRLTDAYDVSRAQCLEDTLELLRELKAEGLINLDQTMPVA